MRLGAGSAAPVAANSWLCRQTGNAGRQLTGQFAKTQLQIGTTTFLLFSRGPRAGRWLASAVRRTATAAMRRALLLCCCTGLALVPAELHAHTVLDSSRSVPQPSWGAPPPRPSAGPRAGIPPLGTGAAAQRTAEADSAELRLRGHDTAMHSRATTMETVRDDAHRNMAMVGGVAADVAHPPHIVRRLRRPAAQHATADLPVSEGVIDVSQFADPTGGNDASPGLHEAIAMLLQSSDDRRFGLWSNVTDLSGRRLELSGGEYLLQSPLFIPSGVGNFRIQGGTLRAGPLFPKNTSLLTLGDESGKHIESVSLTSLVLHGGGVIDGSVLRIVYGVGIDVGPAVYVEGFTGVGIEVTHGAETLIHNCWFVGQ